MSGVVVSRVPRRRIRRHYCIGGTASRRAWSACPTAPAGPHSDIFLDSDTPTVDYYDIYEYDIYELDPVFDQGLTSVSIPLNPILRSRSVSDVTQGFTSPRRPSEDYGAWCLGHGAAGAHQGRSASDPRAPVSPLECARWERAGTGAAGTGAPRTAATHLRPARGGRRSPGARTG
jgi:hypothetical protein